MDAVHLELPLILSNLYVQAFGSEQVDFLNGAPYQIFLILDQ